MLNALTSWEEKTGHRLERCKSPLPCGGCRPDSGMDCRFEALAYCKICGGLEGALLPTCPERWLSTEEHDTNYQHYCNNTGPFANG